MRKLVYPQHNPFSGPDQLPTFFHGEGGNVVNVTIKSPPLKTAIWRQPKTTFCRERLLGWLRHRMQNDSLAAEYMLVHCVSRCYKRVGELNIGHFPVNLVGYVLFLRDVLS